jgi:hypothetical protein
MQNYNVLGQDYGHQAKGGSPCWWCETSTSAEYYNGLCFGCTNKLADQMFPGVMGQGKSGENKVFWDKLKIMVTQIGLPPTPDLVKALVSTANHLKGVPDIDKAIEILKAQMTAKLQAKM